MTTLTDHDCKTIIARRDRRYDGRFYFGVKTTRIYCRPVCPARPKPENILIFRSASEAEKNGYRPCLRCRPDAAPGSKLLAGTRNTVTRALRLIQERSDDGGELGVEALADALGVTDRHLRRLFDEHLGASPVEILITRRLHFAKQLLQETATPVAEIAFAAGFHSLRRFNEAFKDRYRQAPTALRAKGAAPADVLALRLPVHAPYDWDVVAAYLARHATAGIERVEGGVYRRYLASGHGFGFVDVAPAPKGGHLLARYHDVPLAAVRGCHERLKILLDTDHNPADLPADAGLAPRGIRVPASFEPFETAVTIILGQLVSTAAARTKQGVLVERFGAVLGAHEGRTIRAFPAPAALAAAPLEEIGLPRVKAGAIRALAQAVLSGAVDFGAHGDLAAARDALLALRGIGPWTAAMIAMRCLGDPDAFPATDLIVQRARERKLVDETRWSAARAYLTHCLWRDLSATLAKKPQETS